MCRLQPQVLCTNTVSDPHAGLTGPEENYGLRPGHSLHPALTAIHMALRKHGAALDLFDISNTQVAIASNAVSSLPSGGLRLTESHFLGVLLRF